MYMKPLQRYAVLLLFILFPILATSFSYGEPSDNSPKSERLFGLQDLSLLYTNPEVKELLDSLVAGLDRREADPSFILTMRVKAKQLEQAARLEKDNPYAPLLYLLELFCQAIIDKGSTSARRSLQPVIEFLEKELEANPDAPALRRVLQLALFSALTDPGQGEELCGDALAERLAANATRMRGIPEAALLTPLLPSHVLPEFEFKPESYVSPPLPEGQPITVGIAFEQVLDQAMLTGMESIPFYELMLMCGSSVPDKAAYFSAMERLFNLGKGPDTPAALRNSLPAAQGTGWQSFLMRWYQVYGNSIQPELAPSVAAILYRMDLPASWAEAENTEAAYLHAGNLLAQWSGYPGLRALRTKAVDQYLKAIRLAARHENGQDASADPRKLAAAQFFFDSNKRRMKNSAPFWAAWAGLTIFYPADGEAGQEARDMLQKALTIEPENDDAMFIQKYLENY